MASFVGVCDRGGVGVGVTRVPACKAGLSFLDAPGDRRQHGHTDEHTHAPAGVHVEGNAPS